MKLVCVHLEIITVLTCLLFSVTGMPADEIKVEDRAQGILPQGPWLPDSTYKEGELPEELELPNNPNWHIIQKAVTWSEAILICANFSWQLVVLPNSQEAGELIDALDILPAKAEEIDNPENWGTKDIELGNARRYWIGLTDQVVEGKWMWIGVGIPLDYDDRWYPGQPSHLEQGNDTPGEHCGSLWNPGYYVEFEKYTFNDAPCMSKYYPICDTRDLDTLKLLHEESS